MSMLTGVVVVDFSPTVGVLATSALGDLGADVVHVGRPPAPGAPLDAVGRNKKSIALDLKSQRGREIALRLVDRADVVVEGFRPGVAERLGIDYPSLAARRPALVYCSLSGYGQSGPYAQRAGHDLNYQGVSGAVQFGRDGRPVMPTGPWADRGAVANLQIAVLAGLVARLSHGRGVCLDVAMVDAMMTIPLEQQFVVNGVGRLPTGGPSGSSLPRTKMMSGDFCWYGLYECSDNSWLSIACMEHHFWRRLCQYLNRPDWLPLQFEGANVQNGMRKFLSDMFISKPRAAWLDEMWARDLPVAPVNSGVEVLQDPQISHRGSVLPVVLPGCQPMWQIGRAFTAGDKRFAPRRTMTVSGMDSEEVLAGLEYEEDTVRQLLEDRVVVATEFPAADPGAG